eukprot:14291253-Alexandrium_andersonii.AAC.1
MRATKCESALHPAGSVLEQFLAPPQSALTEGAPVPPDPQKALRARAGGAFGGVRGVGALP